jgi:7-cyano-7-deazaguanine synthase
MNLNHETAIVVLSGGQDSSTCLFWAKRHYKNVHAVTIDYGQKHALELKAAQNLATLAEVDSHEIIKVGPILDGTSPLTNPGENLELYEDHDSMAAIIGDRVEKTFVPMRNALFLNIVANRAVCLGAKTMITGVCQADNANYPDCRQTFIDAQQRAINEALGLESGIEILTPLMNLSKAESIELAYQLSSHGINAYDALAFSHTAYDGQFPPVGKDHASVLRAHGFEQADRPDPLVVRADMMRLMSLPTTHNYTSERAQVEIPRLRTRIRNLNYHYDLEAL